MIGFTSPAALALIALAPAASILRAVSGRRRPRRLTLPLDAWGGGAGPDAPIPWRAARAIAALCSWLAWAALCAAAAGPVVERSRASWTNAGGLVVFAIDVSPSMAAADMEPTRLGAARDMVRGFIESADGVEGASVGLVAFGAEAALACPPTTDYATVLARLESLEPGMLGEGTALGQGLASAARLVAVAAADRAAVALLSDGEDNVGLVHPVDAARSLAALGARFLVVGMGSRGEVPIDYVDPTTGQRLSGLYRSGFDSAVLADIAESGGGSYRSATDSRALEDLEPDLAGLARRGAEPGGPARGYATRGYPARTSSARASVARPFFLAAMALAAVAWGLRRLVLGGLA